MNVNLLMVTFAILVDFSVSVMTPVLAQNMSDDRVTADTLSDRSMTAIATAAGGIEIYVAVGVEAKTINGLEHRVN